MIRLVPPLTAKAAVSSKIFGAIVFSARGLLSTILEEYDAITIWTLPYRRIYIHSQGNPRQALNARIPKPS